MRNPIQTSRLVASPRNLTLVTLTTLCALITGLVFAGTPANALVRHELLSQLTGFAAPVAVAVDSNSDVYVADGFRGEEPKTVDRFDASGAPLPFSASEPYVEGSKLIGTPTGPGGSVVLFGGFNEGGNGLAVDNATGDLYVAEGAVIDVFRSSGEYLSQLTGTPAGAPVSGPFGCVPGLVFAQKTQDLYVMCGESIDIFDSSGAYVSQFQTGVPGTSFAFDELTNDTYIDAYRKIYLVNASGTQISPPWTGAETNGAFTQNNKTSLAVDQATGRLYAASFEGSSELIATVLNEFGASSSEEDLGLQATVSQPSSSISASIFLDGIALGPATDDLYLSELNFFGVSTVKIYGPDVVYAAEIANEHISNVHLHSATLNAQLNGGSHIRTSYHFEYGPTSAYGASTPSAGTEGETSATAQVEGLQPETEYHFRIVATNINGTSYGPDTTFSTQTNQIGLPDGRGYEMVSPIDNADGNVYEPHESGFGAGEATELPMLAAANGDAVEYVAEPQATGGNGTVGSGHGNEYVATRAAGGGWSTVNLETPGLDKAPFEALLPNQLANSGAGAVSAGSDLLFEGSDAVLDGGEGKLEKELRAALKPELEEKRKLEVEAAKLNASSPGLGVHQELEAQRLPRIDKLYESVGGRLSLVSVLPGGEVADGSTTGSHVISADGSRIFWTAGSGDVYVREDGARTVAVSAGAAEFWTASPDGQYAFYTEGERLWRFDTEDGSRVELAGEGAGVLDVLGVNETGEDGAYVYFVADGVLGDGAEHGAVAGDCKANPSNGDPEGSCNMYVLHGGVTTFITVLPAADLFPAANPNAVNLHGPGSGVEVSADGRAMVFQSNTSLAGHGGQGTPQIYIYDAVGGGLSCVSCDPTGAAGGGSALRRGSSGWISEDGNRVFFESYTALVAQDTDGTQDVYEWEREGAGSCAQRLPARPSGGCIYLLSGGTSSSDSFFLGAGASGNDVFIISRAQLTAQDQGETYEVYDARIGAVEPPAEQACSGTGCQGLPSAPPPFATPSSVTFNGVGNFPAGSGTGGRAINPVKPKTKTVKCAKGKRLSRNKCVTVKTKKKTKAKMSASNDRRAH